ncbi:MAG: NAD-dependent epimerase/dehydratase family protein, partial [Colwellia sp.]
MGVLLTGSTGFVGSGILQKTLDTVVLGRSCPAGFEGKYIKRELSSNADYRGSFDNVDVIIHCAARVHVMNVQSSDALQAFREVNVDGTLNLFKQAAQADVKRFIFISSIKVNGEGTENNSKYTSVN